MLAQVGTALICIEGLQPRKGRGHRAWGFNPRKRAQNTSKSPDGAHAARFGLLAACAPSGLPGMGGCAYLRPLAGLKNDHFHQIADSGVFSSVEQALPNVSVRSLKI